MHAILVDVTRCHGCDHCVLACAAEHHHDPLAAVRERITSGNDLSASRLCTVTEVAEGRFARKACMHCLEPSCVSACLVGGLTKSPDGPVLYDPAKCIGCRYCMLACPFEVPRYEWDRLAPLVQKCDLCADRLANDELPACVESCPHGALQFGDRDELLAEAHERISGPTSAYLDHVWGEEELGGTSVLYVSDVDLASLGWPAPGAPPIPTLTEPLIAKTPHIAVGVAATLLGLSWIVRRRNQLAAEAALACPAGSDPRHEEGLN